MRLERHVMTDHLQSKRGSYCQSICMPYEPCHPAMLIIPPVGGCWKVVLRINSQNTYKSLETKKANMRFGNGDFGNILYVTLRIFHVISIMFITIRLSTGMLIRWRTGLIQASIDLWQKIFIHWIGEEEIWRMNSLGLTLRAMENSHAHGASIFPDCASFIRATRCKSMVQYRRNRVIGGRYFFTVALRNRKSTIVNRLCWSFTWCG